MISLLHTDKYKPAMALAGFYLRRETFTLTFRKGGPFLVPFDLAERVQALRPDPEEEAFADLDRQRRHHLVGAVA